MIETQKYIRKPLYVDVVRVTTANFDEVAVWCQGEILHDEPSAGHPAGKKYIKVRTHQPKGVRQTKAYVGDWLLHTQRGYKVYTTKAFYASFDMAPEPIVCGGVELMPGTTVNDAVEQLRQAEETGVQPIEEVYAKSETVLPPILETEEATPQGEPIEEVQATPESIAEAVQQNEHALDAEGKQVLSLEDQSRMDQEEIRELLKSGEWILAQDLAA